MKCNKTFLVMGIFLMLSTVSCDFNKDGAEKIKNQKEVNVADNAQQDLENKINQLESDVNNLKTSQSSTDNTVILQELKKILREISILKVSRDKMSKDIAALKTSQGKAKQQQKGKEPTAAQSAVVKNIPIGDSMVLGNPDAPVTIIKWTDFQWPYCAKSVRLIDDILKMHPNDVKVVIKNFPLNFHKQAKDAAKYALAADKQKICGPNKDESCYKDMYHLIFCGTTETVEKDKCTAWRQLKTNPDIPLEYAEKLGLDMVKLKKDAKDPSLDALLAKEGKELSDNFARKSVPKFLVAGREPAKRDLQTWSDLIKAELKK